MAGIKLPDYHALGEPMAPNVPQGVARYNNAEAPGQSVVGFGQETQKAGIDLKQLQDVADINNVQANVLQPKLDALAQNFYSLQGVAAMNAFKGDAENNVPSYNQQVMQAVNDSANQLTGSAREAVITAGVAQAKSEMYRAAAHSGTQMVQYAEQSHQAAQEMETQQITAAVSSNDTLAAQDGIKMYQARQGLHDNSMGNATGSDLYNYHQQQSNDKLAQAILQAQPGADQQKLMRALLTPSTAAVPATTGTLGAPSPYNLGNVKTPQGAANNTQDFVQPLTPADGVALAANTLRSGYQGMTLAQIGAKWTPDPNWVNNVSKSSGFAPTDTPNLNDPKQLTALLNGIAIAEKAPADRANFTPDIIQQGIHQSLVGLPVKTAAQAVAPGQYAQNTTQANDAGGSISSTAPPIAATVVPKPSLFGIPVSPSTVPKLAEMANANAAHEAKVFEMKNDADFQKTQSDFFNKSDPSNPTLTWKDIQSSNLPVQGVGGKEWWVERLDKGAEKTDPEKFNKLMERAMLPDGDPNKLTDPKELLSYVGKGITPSNMGVIQKVMAGGADEKEMLNQTLKVVKTQVSGEDKFPGMKDPKGEELYATSMPLIFKAIDDGHAKGIPNAQLFDPSNPNWVGNAAKPLIRPQDKWYSDLAASNMTDYPGAPGAEPANNKPGFWHYFNPFNSPADTHAADRLTSDLKNGKLSPADGVQHIKDAYAQGVITRQQAADMLVSNGLAATTAPTGAPQVPKPE